MRDERGGERAALYAGGARLQQQRREFIASSTRFFASPIVAITLLLRHVTPPLRLHAAYVTVSAERRYARCYGAYTRDMWQYKMRRQDKAA